MAQPFFLCLSPKVAEFWFSDHQRALANALSFVGEWVRVRGRARAAANPLGVVVGSVMPMIFVSNVSSGASSNDILALVGGLLVPPDPPPQNSVLLILSTVVILMSFTIRSSKPPTPPSASSECANAPAFLQGLCQLFG